MSGLVVAAGYLVGSVSAAIIVARCLHLPDPRRQGSGNPGATNMLRFGGKKAGLLTLLGDLLKGVLPVLLAKWLATPEAVVAATGLATFLGHLYPVFFGFRGGKGVATTLGVALGLYWPVGFAALGTWLLTAFLFRISSLAALVATFSIPFYFWWLHPEPAFVLVSILITAILYWRHRSNIRHLINGTEGRIGG
ncbi:MAG: glycerol-3-phosphate 1-O-acyltransferase PlsY [Gammaproteobacteria bacterium]